LDNYFAMALYEMWNESYWVISATATVPNLHSQVKVRVTD